jgi:hypothetical protein
MKLKQSGKCGIVLAYYLLDHEAVAMPRWGATKHENQVQRTLRSTLGAKRRGLNVHRT